ncbi:MAG: alpha/beta hydrolase [Cyanobacteria bacterium P01_D01_bin.123]
MGVRIVKGDRHQWTVLALAICTGMLHGGLGAASRAAENIQVEVGPASRTFSVAELSDYAQTGTVSRQLQYYFDQLGDEAIGVLTDVLTYPIEVNFVPFAKFLRSPGGECLLDKMAQFVQPDIATLSGSQSLRAALVNAASPDGKMNAIEVLEKYPTSTIQIDQNALQGEGDRFAELEDDIYTLFEDADIDEDTLTLTEIDYDMLAERALEPCEKL